MTETVGGRTLMGSYRVLWVEEDYMDPFESALELKGYEVVRAFFLSEAIEELKKGPFDLVLLDVMIPIEDEDVDLGFTYESTKGGTESGLAFYQWLRAELGAGKKTRVLVYTILDDDVDVRRRFIELGLLEENYLSKVNTSNVNDLIWQVERVLRYKRPVTGEG
jgi:CheY-like chemotaxis protein